MPNLSETMRKPKDMECVKNNYGLGTHETLRNIRVALNFARQPAVCVPMVRLRTTHLAIHEAIHSLQRLSTNVACMRLLSSLEPRARALACRFYKCVHLCSQPGRTPPPRNVRPHPLHGGQEQEPSACISQHVNVGRNARRWRTITLRTPRR